LWSAATPPVINQMMKMTWTARKNHRKMRRRFRGLAAGGAEYCCGPLVGYGIWPGDGGCEGGLLIDALRSRSVIRKTHLGHFQLTDVRLCCHSVTESIVPLAALPAFVRCCAGSFWDGLPVWRALPRFSACFSPASAYLPRHQRENVSPRPVQHVREIAREPVTFHGRDRAWPGLIWPDELTAVPDMFRDRDGERHRAASSCIPVSEAIRRKASSTAI
jgi:hypothetical protein